MASLPFALLQGVGRSDITAKIHLAETPGYLLLMLWLTRDFGINGTAIAWCARTTIDMLLLYWYAGRHAPLTLQVRLRDVGALAALVPSLGLGIVFPSPLQRVVLTSVLLTLFVVTAWYWMPASGSAWIGRLLGVAQNQTL